ncbi:tetratricopeptide repeat protein [Pedobacter sp. PWIIR3]
MNNGLKHLLKYAFLVFLFLVNTISISYGQKDDDTAIEKLIKSNPNSAFIQIKGKLDEAIRTNDHLLSAKHYQYLGQLFYYQAAYSQAINYYYKANEIYKNSGNTANLANNLNKIGESYYYGKQYAAALRTFQDALKIYTKLGDHNGIASSYGLIGQTYEKNGKYLTSMKLQRMALAEYHKAGDKTGLAKIYENMGSIYEDKLPMDSALKYYRLALALNRKDGNDAAQTEIVNNIGDVYRKTGKFSEALGFTRTAKAMATKMNDQYQLSAAYRDLSKNFDLMKQYDSAYHYSELGRNIFLKIFTEDNNKQLAILQTLFEIQQKDDAIVRFENEKTANHYIIAATILIIILLISLTLVTISKQRLKLLNEKKLNEQNQSLYESQKSAIKAELELKSKELTSNTLHVIQSNQFLDELKVEMLSILQDDKRDQKKQIQQIVHKINQNITHDSHWKEFSTIFEQIHQTFFDNLKAHSNDLTANDIRLVALIKMNLSSKDMATLFGISQDSLRVARYRLRKKLDIPQGDNLSTFIQAL